VALCHIGDHLARGDIECHTQVGGAVPDLVMGAPFRQTLSKRQHRGGPVQRLDL
jgi:hypothetical protein